jgi:hypothetical protein
MKWPVRWRFACSKRVLLTLKENQHHLDLEDRRPDEGEIEQQQLVMHLD